MDALSQALNSVRMTGAIFFYADCTAPWGFSAPHMGKVAGYLAPGTERLVGYHLVMEGKAVVRFDGMPPFTVNAGDIVIVPHGDPHTVTNGSPDTLVDSGKSVEGYLAGTLTSMRLGGGGERTRFACGYFGCERHADRLFLAGLPPVIQLHIRGDEAGAWLESSIRYLVEEAGAGRPGRTVLLSKMAEALFVATLRRYMEQLPPEHIGWLAGARDPVVGGALALMHREPCRAWSVADIADAVGASRSVVAERFTKLLGEPPLTYLARWRLQLAARLLGTTHRTIVQVATEVGYESEAAFNRAFKREFGLPPARYRRSRNGNGMTQPGDPGMS